MRGQGVEIRLNSIVEAITQVEQNQLRVKTVASSQDYNAVISTSSPALMARIAPDLPSSYSENLRALKSLGAVVLVISLNQRLTNYYWHNLPKEAGFPFLAMVEHTNFVGQSTLAGITSSMRRLSRPQPQILPS